MNQFHAAESSQRAASDVFKSSATQQASGIASRFASSGKFTHEQLESGEDGKEGKAAEEEDEFDPDDKRPLYERLKSQRDEKQAEWDHAHTFKNQMDHWRLDADDAAFEEDRMAKLKQVEAEASRLHEEGAQFYKLARAQQDRTAPLAAPTAPPPQKRKQPPPKKPAAPALTKMLKVQVRPAGSSAAAVPAAAAAPAAPAAPAGLPGMGAYGDDSDDDDDDS